MALTPLTRVQQATVLALVEARRLDALPADPARAASFLRQAEERLDQLPLLTSVTVRYGVAYDACHDTGEALGGHCTPGEQVAPKAAPTAPAAPFVRVERIHRTVGHTRR